MARASQAGAPTEQALFVSGTNTDEDQGPDHEGPL